MRQEKGTSSSSIFSSIPVVNRLDDLIPILGREICFMGSMDSSPNVIWKHLPRHPQKCLIWVPYGQSNWHLKLTITIMLVKKLVEIFYSLNYSNNIFQMRGHRKKTESFTWEVLKTSFVQIQITHYIIRECWVFSRVNYFYFNKDLMLELTSIMKINICWKSWLYSATQ